MIVGAGAAGVVCCLIHVDSDPELISRSIVETDGREESERGQDKAGMLGDVPACQTCGRYRSVSSWGSSPAHLIFTGVLVMPRAQPEALEPAGPSPVRPEPSRVRCRASAGPGLGLENFQAQAGPASLGLYIHPKVWYPAKTSKPAVFQHVMNIDGQAQARPGQTLAAGLGSGLKNLKLEPAQAGPKPRLSGQTGPEESQARTRSGRAQAQAFRPNRALGITTPDDKWINEAIEESKVVKANSCWCGLDTIWWDILNALSEYSLIETNVVDVAKKKKKKVIKRPSSSTPSPQLEVLRNFVDKPARRTHSML
ncbi:hypothetical protein C8R44DRAFT_755095 [Mycena epipterygia]|nr:hypothetical protein C8R44DRAFT_755095 [Mycena epipterygia]